MFFAEDFWTAGRVFTSRDSALSRRSQNTRCCSRQNRSGRRLVPSIALIINTSNQPDYLARVLRSVAAQTSLPEEVLIADDGSGDDTRELIQAWDVAGKLRAEHI